MLLAWSQTFFERVIELFLGPFHLALAFEFGAHLRFKLDEQFDVQRRVISPVTRQRTIRPVSRGMFFGKGQSKKVLGDGGKSESFQSQQTRGDFRVEQPLRFHAEFVESRKILQESCRIHTASPTARLEIVPIRPGRGERLRIEQADAGSVAFELHQPVLMPIPEAGCAFRVRGKEPCEEASSLQ